MHAITVFTTFSRIIRQQIVDRLVEKDSPDSHIADDAEMPSAEPPPTLLLVSTSLHAYVVPWNV